MKLPGLPPNKTDSDRFERIVVHAPNWLGDSVMATPLILAIYSACPQASITVVAPPNLVPLWASLPEVSDVIPFDRFGGRQGIAILGLVRELRRKAFDAAVILPVGPEFVLFYLLAGVAIRTGYAHGRRKYLLTHALSIDAGFRLRHLANSYLELSRFFGFEPAPIHQICLPLPEENPIEILARFNLSGDRPRVLLHVWSSYGPAKRWPEIRFAQLGDLLSESHGAQVILIGSQEAREASQSVKQQMNTPCVDLSGHTSIPDLIRLISTASLLISTDSGPPHLAAALGIPVVSLYGSSSPDWTRVLGDCSKVIYQRLECSPCFQRVCPLGTNACFQQIGVNEVWEAAASLLEAPVRKT